MSSTVKGSNGISVPQIEKCCFCLSLEFGSLTIAACSVLFWIVVLFDIVTSNRYHEENAVQAGIARLLIEMALAALLFVGAQKRISSLILVWVMIECSLIILNVVVAVIIGLFKLNHLMLLGAAIMGTFYTLALVVVFNFYREVRDGRGSTPG